MANFNPAHKAVLDDLLLGDPRVRPGEMFGFRASIRFIADQQEGSLA